ncbi:MAG: transcription termination/antitermination protein NusG [Bacilli bacterium]|nr:transcription termination/antitermination protein NusG [Bacilli bacterium]MDD4282431.1 transcription termination/antitermination protein NusG [Bacilli bacterium]MDD4718901.1 transcription termination/antitermination protein NusG [Bacilli bacterium]
MEKEWYVVNTYSGHENKVKEKLEMRANSMEMEEYIHRIVVPEQTEIEIKDGVKKEKNKKMFPGYILVEMIMTDEAWFIVRNTPGVTGFIGSSGRGAKPFPLTPKEVDKILGSMGMARLELGNELKADDMIKVIQGPFTNMYGKIKTFNLQTQILEVKLDLFGQETIVEIPLVDVEKV